MELPDAVCKSKRFGNQERIFGEIHQASHKRQLTESRTSKHNKRKDKSSAQKAER